MTGSEETLFLTVLESDWGPDAEEERVSRKGMVGPIYTYRDILPGLLKLFDGDVQIDHGYFESAKGFEFLLKRFDSHPKRKILMVVSHGSPRNILAGPEDFNPFPILMRLERPKEGLMLTGCELAARKKEYAELLEEKKFQWVAGYRVESSYLTALKTEITFLKLLLDGWKYYLIKPRGEGGRCTTLKVGGRDDPLGAALATYILEPGAVGLRFDLRTLHKGEMVCSLEVLAAIFDEKLTGVPSGAVPEDIVERYRKPLQGLKERLWELQAGD